MSTSKINIDDMKRDPLAYKIIGCAMEVHNTLGPGLLEAAYEKALMHELQSNGLSAAAQVPVEMNYKGANLGEGKKSIAYTLTFNDPEKTLSDEEVLTVFNKVISKVTSECNAVVRDC